jgi:Ca-activated chloride channel homolog
MMVLALAEPTWGFEVVRSSGDRSAVVFVLDVSRSMDVEDVRPSRLERAKQTLANAFTQLEESEVSLIVFAGTSEVYFPLTRDVFSTTRRVSSITSDILVEQGSNVTTALTQAVSTLSDPVIGQGSIVLMSDGEFSQQDFGAVLGIAVDRGIPIYVLGYGTEEGDFIPDTDATGNPVYVVDETGQPIISRLNEGVLQQIAGETNGQYQRVVDGTEDIAKITEWTSHSQQQNLALNTITTPQRQNIWFVVGATFIMIVEIITKTWSRKDDKNS